MTRPGLIIGLGGTGQWVLTWLKRDLLISNNGQMPDNVRLLAFDTTTQLEAGTSRVSTSGAEEESVEVGGVMLRRSEFVHVGGDSKKEAELVKQGEFPQIGQWYHAQRWLDMLSPATFILDDGAGRIRQFGRMAVYKDMLGQETGSRIWQALRTALEAVRSGTNEARRLEVIVVGSFAGGTGSGMFIDIALILRHLAKQFNIHHVLRGFFALPGVFTNAPDANMKARTLAAWRELNRFMVVNSDFPMPVIEYVENNPVFRIHPQERIFDACYLIEGKRGGQPIAEEAKFGVFPMAAEVISAILDEQAGTAYTQWVFTNLAPEYARWPDMPMYSAIGAYTVQVPAHFVQVASSHDFGQELLLRLLGPQDRPDEQGRLVTSGAARHLALAAPDKNLEDRGFAGRQRAAGFFKESVSYEDKSVRPTRFTSRIGEIIEQAQDDGQRPAIIERLARAGGASRGPAATAGWVAYFPDLGDDPTYEAVRRRVEEQTRFDVRRGFGRREGEKGDEARARFKKIPEEVRRRFGGVTSDEEYEFFGECGDALEECQAAQLSIFRRTVRLKLQSMLMGASDDPLVARSGKLGYAWDYFDGIVERWTEFIELMVAVKRERERIKPELQLAGLEKRARQYLNATRGKTFLLRFEHWNVKKAEDAYLMATQRLVDLKREDVLHHYVIESARMMKDICEQARDNVQRWIWHLATGDDASQLPGLWDQLRASRQRVDNAHAYDTLTPKVQALVADALPSIKEEDLAQALSRWQWNVEFSGQPLRLQLQAQIQPEAADQEPLDLQDPSRGDSPALRLDIGRQNRGHLLNLSGRAFAGVVARTLVADEIKRQYPNPKQFAKSVAQVSAEPLFDGRPGASARRKSNLIRVQAENDTYFSGAGGLEGELRELNQQDREVRSDTYGIQVVGSENPYKLTLVRTDDLYNYDGFTAWGECLAAYAAHMDDEGQPLDPVLMQNFAAESRAVPFERQLTRAGTVYEPLHPRVVMLLENPTALRQFFYLGILGMITEEEAPNAYRWELNWTKRAGPETIWLTRGWDPDTDKVHRTQPDIFNAAHGYAIRRRTWQPGRRDQVDWEFAERLIRQEQENMGREKETQLLKDHLSADGFVGFVENLAYDPDVPDRVLHKDFADLAKVIRIMLNNRLEELDRQESRAADTQRGPSSAFQIRHTDKSELDD